MSALEVAFLSPPLRSRSSRHRRSPCADRCRASPHDQRNPGEALELVTSDAGPGRVGGGSLPGLLGGSKLRVHDTDQAE